MEIWIPITIAAAFLQNLRSMLQKQLKSQMSSMAATFTRFVFALPVAFGVLALLTMYGGYDLPVPNGRFFCFGTLGAIAQITATFLLVYLFGLQNFAIGTAFSKTEAVQTAMVGFVVLGDRISLLAGVAILVSLTGVLVISGVGKGGGIFSKPALIGLASGAGFGVSAVAYRTATLSLPDVDFLIRGASLLAFTTIFQTSILLIYLALRQKGQLRAVFRNWRIGAAVGLVGGLASLGWFTAMTLQNAAYVRALAQVELIFTIMASWYFFREKLRVRDLSGIGLIVAGMLILFLAQ